MITFYVWETLIVVVRAFIWFPLVLLCGKLLLVLLYGILYLVLLFNMFVWLRIALDVFLWCIVLVTNCFRYYHMVSCLIFKLLWVLSYGVVVWVLIWCVASIAFKGQIALCVVMVGKFLWVLSYVVVVWVLIWCVASIAFKGQIALGVVILRKLLWVLSYDVLP